MSQLFFDLQYFLKKYIWINKISNNFQNINSKPNLNNIQKNNINLTKIESRPTKKKVWQYIFFIDFEGHISDKKVINTIEKIKEHCIFLKVLGSYPKADL